jgi:hypothetical protein
VVGGKKNKEEENNYKEENETVLRGLISLWLYKENNQLRD